MADIMELAKKRAEAQNYLTALGVMNSAVGYEDQVKADAKYRLAFDAFIAADRAYYDAVNGLSSDKLSEIADS